MQEIFTFIISNNTILHPFEEGVFEEEIDNLYKLIINDNFKIVGIKEDLTVWSFLNDFYLLNDIIVKTDSIEIKFSLKEDNYNSTFFSWAIYAENVENKSKKVICQSKNIYYIEAEELKELERVNESLTLDQEEAFSRLDNEINYTNILVQNDLKDEHQEIIIDENRKIRFQNEDNIVINKDNNSQEITFQIPREYDGIDLSEKQLYIYYITPKEFRPLKEKLIIDEATLTKESKNFKATWIFKSLATITSGDMTFAIVAEGKDLTDSYFWQTFPATFKIQQGIFKEELEIDDFSTTSENSRYEQILKDVNILMHAYNNGEIIWQKLPEVEV